MKIYRFLRDRSANGTVPNTEIAPVGMIAPKNLYLTKKFKKGDIVSGNISGNSITLTVNDATETSGKPYLNKVDLTTLIYSERDGETTYWIEEIDSENNAIKNSFSNNSNGIKSILSNKIFTTKNIIIGVVGVAVLYFGLKHFKLIK